jgi:hypothetical protein
MILPKIPYGGFSPVRLQGWPIRGCLPRRGAQLSRRRRFAALLRAHRFQPNYPRSVSGWLCAWAPPFERLWSLYPRGPRSGPGYSVPHHQHLIDPMRPTHRHNATSPQGGLYALPSLCTGLACLGDPRVDPCFRWPTFSTCRPLGPREAHRLHPSSSFTDDAGLRPNVKSSALPSPPPSDSRGACDFGALLRFALATTCRFACPPVGADQACAQPTRTFYFRAFDGLVTLSAAGYNYGGNWTISTGGTFTR